MKSFSLCGTNKKLGLFLVYTLIFLFTTACSSVFFFVYDKSCFVGDGIKQHLTSLIYYGDYLRSIICGFFATGKINIPFWDFSLGFGADIIETLHYYCIGDPFALLSVFVNAESAPILYVILIVLRLYLSGLTFMLFCRHHRFDRFSVLCGSIVYVFSGFALYCAARHPFFINPMIYFPLLCLGVDFVFENKNPVLFIFSVFISCVSNFYFFYMLSIITVIYAVVRFFFVFDKKKWVNVWKFFLIFLAAYLVGVLLSAPIFFPQIYGFLNSARSSEIEKIYFLYRPIYYIKFFLAFIAPPTFDSYSTLGFAAPILPVFIYFLSKKDKVSRQLKVFFLIGFIFFMFPIFGCIFNGFSYQTNRWCFAFAFLVSVMFAFVLPDLYNADEKKLKIPLLVSTIISLLVLLISLVEKKTRAQLFLSYFVLLVFCVILFILMRKQKSLRLSFLTFAILAVIVNATVRFGNFGLNYLEEFYDKETARAVLKENKPYLDLPNSFFYRLETASRQNNNSHLLAGFKGTTYYWSENNQLLSNFYKAVSLYNGTDLRSNGLDSRAPLLAITNVAYSEKGSKDCIPFGFRKTETTNETGFVVLENENFLPFGFTYTKVIDEKQVENFSPIERQELMLDYAITNYALLPKVEKIDSLSNVKLLPYQVEVGEGILLDENRITVSRPDSNLRFVFSGDQNSETYFYIKNIFSETNPYEKLFFTVYPPPTENLGKTAEILIKSSDLGHSFAFCFGYNTDLLDSVEVSFESAGIYSFEDLAIYSVSREYFSEKIHTLSEHTLQDLSLDTNKISGTISVSKPSVLFLSMPYSKGWTCYVDGEKKDTFPVQYAFTGVAIESGNHSITLKYHSPFFCAGCIAFLFALVVLVVFVSLACVFHRKAEHKTVGL